MTSAAVNRDRVPATRASAFSVRAENGQIVTKNSRAVEEILNFAKISKSFMDKMIRSVFVQKPE